MKNVSRSELTNADDLYLTKLEVYVLLGKLEPVNGTLLKGHQHSHQGMKIVELSKAFGNLDPLDIQLTTSLDLLLEKN